MNWVGYEIVGTDPCGAWRCMPQVAETPMTLDELTLSEKERTSMKDWKPGKELKCLVQMDISTSVFENLGFRSHLIPATPFHNHPC